MIHNEPNMVIRVRLHNHSGTFVILPLLVALFFFIALTAWGTEMILPAFIMTVAFSVFIATLDFSEKILTGPNIIIGLFWGWGVFFRFLWTGFSREDFLMVSYLKIGDNVAYHTNTSLVILLSLVCAFFIKYKYNKKRLVSVKHEENASPLTTESAVITSVNIKIEFVYVILAFLTYAYKAFNLSYATEQSYGNLDNIFNTVQYCVRFIAYLNLIAFFSGRRARYLFAYCIFAVPYVLLSFISAWKGPIILEMCYFMLLMSWCGRKIKLRHLLILAITMIVMYGFISLRRYSIVLGTNTSVTVKDIGSFLGENNVFKYMTNRFSNYDYVYHVINLPRERAIQFVDNTGDVILRMITALIPRFIYPAKGIVNIGLPATQYIYGFPATYYNNLPLLYIGEVWLYYGLIGLLSANIIVYSALFGLHRKLTTSNAGSMAIYCIYIEYMYYLFNGGYAANFATAVLLFISIKLIRKLLRV